MLRTSCSPFCHLIHPKHLMTLCFIKHKWVTDWCVPLQVTTPLLFKMIPAVVHLGVLLRWFSVDSNQVEVHVHINWVHLLIVLLRKCLPINSSVLPFQLGLKNDGLRIDSGKRINLVVQGSHDSWHLTRCKLLFLWLKFTSSVKYFRRSEEFVAGIQGWWQETQLWSRSQLEIYPPPIMATARAIGFAIFESAVSVNDWCCEWLSTPIEGFV
jgi:hypothetical protein